MTRSSPGQPRIFDDMDELPMTRSLSNSAESPVNHGGTSKPPLDQQEAPVAPPPAPDKSGHSHQGMSQKDASSPGSSEEPMLLKRPSSLFKSFDGDKGYEYGPAVQFAPGFFTQRPGKQALVRVKDHAQHPEDGLPAPSTQGACSPRSHLPSLGRVPVEDLTNNRFRTPGPSNQPRTQPLAIEHGLAESRNNKHGRPVAARKIPQMLEKPPFSDTSPKEPAVLSSKTRPAHIETQPATTLGKAESKTTTSVPVTADKVTPDPQPHVSPHIAQYGYRAEPYRESSRHRQQVPLARAEKEEGGYRSHLGHRLPVPTERPRLLENEPADRTRNPIVAQPMSEVAHIRPVRSIHRARPESRSSNVSKQRSRCGSLASSPMVRQRRANISHEFTNGLAGVINQFTHQQNAALEEQKAKYHKCIKRLKRELADESSVVAQQTSQIDAQTNKIEVLQESKEQMTSQLEDIEAKLGASEDRARRLEEKYRACKTHLNSAIQEQQDLYTRSKNYWSEAIEQVRAMEKSQHAETEMVVRKAEVLREQMLEKVRETIAQNKVESLELHGRIDVLTKQVEEKEAELSRERECVRSMFEKLQDLRATSSGFEAVAVQGKEILQKIGEQQTRAEEQHQKSAEELRDKLDLMANRLEALANVTSGQPEVLVNIRQAQDESLQSVTSKLDDILESRNVAGETTRQLSTDLEHHMGKIWQRLDNQLESVSKQLAEKAEENGMMSTLYRRKEAECEAHTKELAALRETTEKQTDQIHELETNLFALDAAHDENEETIRQLQASGVETDRLREELNSKVAAVAELQSKLNSKEKAYASELQEYSTNMHNLAQAIREKDQSSAVAVQQAAETARREGRADLRKLREETDQLYREMEQQRVSLAEQLERLKQKVHEKEENEAQSAATIRSLQERLATEEAKGKLISQQLAQRSASLEQLESQLTSRAKDLETELKATKDRAASIEGETQRQHARSEALIGGLKRWLHQEGHVVDDLDWIKDGNRSEEEISTGLVRILGDLSLSQKPQTVAPESHAGGLIRDENSKFLSSANLPQEDAKNHADGGAETSQSTIDDIGTEAEGNAVEDTFGNDPLSFAASLHHMRRVVVRSPANVLNEPAAPSIDQEKTRRREGVQPRSIMKHVTRSTSKLSRQGEPDGLAGHGTFKRSRSKLDESPIGSSNSAGLRRRPSKAESTPATEIRTVEGNSGRPNKRRRSETANPDQSISQRGRSSQGRKTEPSASTPNAEDSGSKNRLSTIDQQGGFGSGRQGQPPNANSIHDPKAATARNPRRNSGVGTRGLGGTLSGTIGPRPNVRTYGSQRVSAGEPSAGAGYTDSRFSLRSQSQSQSQSQFWGRPKDEESQESIAFSQGVGREENLLLPFQA